MQRLSNRYYTAKNVQCRNCNKNGHLSKNCPEPKVSTPRWRCEKKCKWFLKAPHCFLSVCVCLCRSCQPASFAAPRATWWASVPTGTATTAACRDTSTMRAVRERTGTNSATAVAWRDTSSTYVYCVFFTLCFGQLHPSPPRVQIGDAII